MPFLASSISKQRQCALAATSSKVDARSDFTGIGLRLRRSDSSALSCERLKWSPLLECTSPFSITNGAQCYLCITALKLVVPLGLAPRLSTHLVRLGYSGLLLLTLRDQNGRPAETCTQPLVSKTRCAALRDRAMADRRGLHPRPFPVQRFSKRADALVQFTIQSGHG